MGTYPSSNPRRGRFQGRTGFAHVAPIVRDVLLALRVTRPDGSTLTRHEKIARLPWGLR